LKLTDKVITLVKEHAPEPIAGNAGAATHSAVALALSFLFVYLGVPWYLVAVVNGLAWFCRENVQTDKRISYWSTHVHVEWIAPSLTGTIVAYVTSLFI
jgi:hypothetical protein